MIDPQIPALIWQSDIEALVTAIQERHARLSADFNRYVVSEATMEFCARIQQHVNACLTQDGYGLLTRSNHRS